MADDVTTQSATLASVPAGGVYAFDLINGVLYARSKTGWGADGSYVDTSAANPLPVVQTGTPALPTGAATAANQTTLIGHVDGIETLLAAVATLAEQQSQTTQLTAAAASLSVMDDWDETDRAKVNPIVGQAGLQGGSGSVSANTQRVVLATDVALPAGTNAIGAVTARLTQIRIPATPTISAASIYASGDAIGGKLTFGGAARVSGGTITVTAVLIVDKDQELAPLELWLFNDDFTNTSDNAVFDPTDADLASKYLGMIRVNDYANANDNSVAIRECRLTGTLVGTSLYGQLVVRSTPTYTATDDLAVVVQVVQD